MDPHLMYNLLTLFFIPIALVMIYMIYFVVSWVSFWGGELYQTIRATIRRRRND